MAEANGGSTEKFTGINELIGQLETMVAGYLESIEALTAPDRQADAESAITVARLIGVANSLVQAGNILLGSGETVSPVDEAPVAESSEADTVAAGSLAVSQTLAIEAAGPVIEEPPKPKKAKAKQQTARERALEKVYGQDKPAMDIDNNELKTRVEALGDELGFGKLTKILLAHAVKGKPFNIDDVIEAEEHLKDNPVERKVFGQRYRAMQESIIEQIAEKGGVVVGFEPVEGDKAGRVVMVLKETLK